MKRTRFTEEQIIALLREQEAGSKTAEVCRKHGASPATFYKWKAKYGGTNYGALSRATYESFTSNGTIGVDFSSGGKPEKLLRVDLTGPSEETPSL
jgi:hypothetical protein